MHIWKLPRTHFSVSSNQFLWNSGLNFLGFIIQSFAIFQGPDFCFRLRKSFASKFSGFWWLIPCCLWKGKFHGLYESQRKTCFRGFRILGKVSYENQVFQILLDVCKGFQGLLNILYLQDKLVSYFHSKSSTLWLIFIPGNLTCHLLAPVFWIFKIR